MIMIGGHCMIHGRYFGYMCPGCSTSVPYRPDWTAPYPTVPSYPTTPIYPTTPRPVIEPVIPEVGWKCPNCGGGVAPFMPYCPFCPIGPPVVTTDHT